MNKLKYMLLLCLIALVSACGGSDSDDDSGGNGGSGNGNIADNIGPSDINPAPPAQILLTGVLIDAGPVSGLSYDTPTQSGETNSDGQFTYQDGENIEFSIGEASLGDTVLAGAVITTPSISGATETDVAPTTNLTRLLQTLDDDGDASNGITVTDDAVQTINNNNLSINLEQTVDAFEGDADVLTLVTNGGQDTPATELIDTNTAGLNLFTSLTTNYFIGSWELSIPVELGGDDLIRAFIVFLDESTFVFGALDEGDFDGSDTEGGMLGVERGTYSFAFNTDPSPTTVGDLQLVMQFDTDGTEGLFDDNTIETIPLLSTADNSFTGQVEEDGTLFEIVFSRTANDSNGVVGTWLEERDDPTELPIVQFLPNGIFYFIEDPGVSASGLPHIDIASYNYNETNDQVTFEFLATSNPNNEETLPVTINRGLSVSTDMLTLSGGEDGDNVHTRLLPYQ